MSSLPKPLTPPPGLTLQHTLQGHSDAVISVAWSPDGSRLASSSEDHTVRLWDPSSARLLHTLQGHTAQVWSVAWSLDGSRLASSSEDHTVRLWDPSSACLLHTLQGHTYSVGCVAWSPDGTQLVSGSADSTVRLWDPSSACLLHTLQGHTASVDSVAWSPDGTQLASGSWDCTVRLWDPSSPRLLHTLQDSTSSINSLVWSPDGKLLVAAGCDHSKNDWIPRDVVHIIDTSAWENEVRFIRTDIWEPVTILTGLTDYGLLAWHPHLPLLATVGQRKQDILIWHMDKEQLLGRAANPETKHYKNAKVVLVGESCVGKSGLALVLTGQPFIATESTHGLHVWNFDSQEVSLHQRHSETRETLLWDLAGQPGYRLIHQLHLDEVAVALVIFDAHSETDPFAGVRHWDSALRLAQHIQGSSALLLKKFLVAARTDRGGIGVSPERIQAVVHELGFDGYFTTSAREGWQIDELRTAVARAINWEMLPKVSSTVLFRQIQQFLLDEKQQAKRPISSVEDLYCTFLLSQDAPEETPELRSQFETCIGQVESTGLIKRLSFGNLVLLQPGRLDAYAYALINAVKDEPDGLGSIAEEQVRAGNFRMPADERMQDVEREKLLLITMIEDLLRRELALREDGMLVFPSQSTKENPDLPDPQGKSVVFTFEGSVLNIYATLAVRLARSGLFKKKDLWKNVVTYTTRLAGTCGMYLRNIGEGRGELTLFFDKSASLEARHVFTEYVRTHLLRRSLPSSFNIRYVLVCGRCDTVIPDDIIQRRKAWNLAWLPCPVCESHVSLVTHVQQRTEAPSSCAQEMDQASDKQRERETAQSTLQGKIATGDFDVFLCHHSADKPIVKQIGEQLKEQGILPWLDEWELQPGLPWQRILEQQIKQIKSAAVFVGKNGIGPWQQQELEAFLREFVKRRCPVIPILLQNARKKPKLPLFLEGLTWVDFRLQDPDPLQWLLWGITGKRETGEGRRGR